MSSLGIQTASKKGDGTYKADEEKKKAEGNMGGVPYQIVRIETPVKLIPAEPKIDELTGKRIDPQTGKLT